MLLARVFLDVYIFIYFIQNVLHEADLIEFQSLFLICGCGLKHTAMFLLFTHERELENLLSALTQYDLSSVC